MMVHPQAWYSWPPRIVRRTSPRGAITHSFSLTICVRNTFPHNNMWLCQIQSLCTEELFERHFTFYHCVECSLGISGDLKIDSFFFRLRRNSFLVSTGPNSFLIRSHWFLESIFIPGAYGNSKFASLLTMDFIIFAWLWTGVRLFKIALSTSRIVVDRDR